MIAFIKKIKIRLPYIVVKQVNTRFFINIQSFKFALNFSNMAAKKETEKEYAKLLFIKHGMNQKDIALKVKVTDKTIGKWASDGKWLAQKESLFATRSNIIEKLTNQIRLLNDKFENREDKLATLQEGRLLVDYARSIKSLENEIGVGETITTLRDFVSFLQTVNFELSLKVNDYADMFINHKIK